MNQENLGAASIANEESLLFNNTYYAITITPSLRDHIVYSPEFEPIITKRLYRFKRIKQVWELTKTGVLHTHILAQGRKDIKYKLIHLYGWHIHIEPLTTTIAKLKWESYITKHHERDILLEHAAAHEYLFD